jgi:hypothetical protein
MRKVLFVLLLVYGSIANAQEPAIQTKQDTSATQKEQKYNPFATGYYPLGFFDIDLKYIIKYNNYEGLRLGIGGVTNNRLSEKNRISGYVARGFIDEKIKYSVGGSTRLNKEQNTWLSIFYINDITEIGTPNYLTDARVYSVFEPRLVNVTQFYKHRTWQTNIQHEFTPKIFSEFRLSKSKIEQTENYNYYINNQIYNDYEVAEVTASIRISPKTNFFTSEDGLEEYYDGLPKISAQITQGVRGIFNSDFSYTKFGLKMDYLHKRTNLSSTHILWEASLALGEVPLTHLYHAYPNNPTKGKILKRFSVAGRRSFETMYFGEFFSDKLTTLQVRHSLRRFNIAKKIKPELVLITRHAIGDLKNKEEHIGLVFNTLNQFYSESGFEINKIFFGFGLSFAYRYGYYSLPHFDDNLSFKFTFYLKP